MDRPRLNGRNEIPTLPDFTPELPAPVPRQPAHSRTTQFLGFQREDGLWDVEAQMLDTKPFDFEYGIEAPLPAHVPLHRMLIRITFDAQLTVVDIVSAMADHPHDHCTSADRHMRRMIGSSMAKGWRKSIEEHLGKVEGCTHMRELLFNMATVAFQTIAPHNIARYERLRQQGTMLQIPPHLGQCHAFDLSGPVVERLYPMFFQPQASPPARNGNPESQKAASPSGMPPHA